MTSPHGFLLIDKPAGLSSYGVCHRVKKQLSTKKVGHAGTLDPFATGLMLLAVGRYTRLLPYFDGASKTYRATARLGMRSTTGDVEGDLTPQSEPITPPTQEAIAQLLEEQFTGKLWQTPPAYSALKVKGQRAYALARAGQAVELAPREVTVEEITLLRYTWPEVEIAMRVSSGFYVRSLVADLGEALGTGAYCTALERTAIAHLRLSDALPLQAQYDPEVPEEITPAMLLDADAVLPPEVLRMEITADRYLDCIHGRAFPAVGAEGWDYLVRLDGHSIAMGQLLHGKLCPRVRLA